MEEYTASGRPKLSIVIPKAELPEIIGPVEEENPLTCDLCHHEIKLLTDDDGTISIGPGGGTWNVCGGCRSNIVAQFPSTHEYQPPDDKDEEESDTSNA